MLVDLLFVSYGELRGATGSYGELQGATLRGATGSYRELWGATGSYGELQGAPQSTLKREQESSSICSVLGAKTIDIGAKSFPKRRKIFNTRPGATKSGAQIDEKSIQMRPWVLWGA